MLGIHSFYAGKTVIGVIQLITLGGCGIWALIDFIMIVCGNYKDLCANITKSPGKSGTFRSVLRYFRVLLAIDARAR